MFKSDHTAFNVRDLDASREFYEYLGGRVVSKPSPHFLEVMLGDLRLHMVRAGSGARAADEAAVQIDHVCVSVPTHADLCAVRDRINAHPALRAQGLSFEIEESEMLGAGQSEHAEERPPLRTLYVTDPDGIRIEIRAYA